ncbi:hypothetical protein TWF506_011420 [Arthrobotrys conoides]|uniref:F-box domain-containing protein n=1 Tax=Arthrobotrys conoides TaxID=74498 RepID=A0AAN8N665_9PEZI
MTAFTDLSAQPEILYLIFQYLPSKDLFSLMRCCKALYPTCYREIWTTLVLDSTKRLYIPDRDIVQPGSLKALIKTPGVQRFGFKYTKHLVLGTGLKGLSYALHTDLGRILRKVLQSGELCPRRLTVALDELPGYNFEQEGYDVPRNKRRPLKLLDALKEYGKGKNLQEFSVSIRASCFRHLPGYFTLSQVTQLELNPYLGTRRRDWKAGKAQKRTDKHIEELTTLLKQTPNLKELTIGDWFRKQDLFLLYTRPLVGQEWRNFQTTMTSLQRLKTFKVVTYLFHPSLFLIPPPSVTELLCTGTVSPVWWKTFAKCEELGNVRYLTIQVPDFTVKPARAVYGRHGVPVIKSIELGEVAITGLREFAIARCFHHPEAYFQDQNQDDTSTRCHRDVIDPLSRNIPVDLEDCIVRRNPNLSQDSLKMIGKQKSGDRTN